MDIETNSVEGHRVVLVIIGKQNELNRMSGFAQVLFAICTHLPGELDPFETVPPAQLNGGYSSSSHSGRIIVEELS